MSTSSAVPASSLGVVAHAAGDLRVEDVALGEIAPDEAVVRIAFGGICGSDLHYWRDGAAGASVLREPLLLGHEVVGMIAEAAPDGSGPPVGTEVAVHPHTELPGDGSRYPAARPNLAPGSTYLGSAAHLPHTQGGFARYTRLPTRMLRPLPPGLSLRDAAVAEPAAVAWHAVSRAGRVEGRRVLVTGAGPIGALAVAVAVRAGAASVVATDLAASARERALALGADDAIDAGHADAVAAVDADVALESSGTTPGLDSAIAGTTRGGRVVMVGLQRGGPQPAALATVITRELELVGSFRFAAEFDDVLAALADGSLRTAPVVSHVLPVEDALAAFELAADAERSGKVLLEF